MMIIVIYDRHHIIQNHRVICRGAGGSTFKKKNKVALNLILGIETNSYVIGATALVP